MADAAFDINRYALSIELQLSTSAAFKSIDDLGTRAEQIEEQISKAASQTFQSISDTVSKINDNIKDMAKAFMDAAKHSKTILTPNLKLDKTVQSMLDSHEAIKKFSSQNADTIIQFIKDNEKLSKIVEAQLDAAKLTLKAIEDTEKAIKAKNLQHKAQLDYMESEKAAAVETNDSILDQGEAVAHSAKNLKHLQYAWHAVWGTIKHAVAMGDKYYQTNFRIYGSQQEIILQARQLSLQYDLLIHDAEEAYEALGNLNMPKAELQEYAKIVGQVSRITGVAGQSIAVYLQKLRSVGYSSSESTRQLAWMTQAMRTLGLSADDTSKILGDSSVSARELMTAFAEGKDAPAKFDRMKMSLAGFAKALAATPREMEQLTATIDKVSSDFVGRGIWADALGRDIRTVDDYQAAMLAVGATIKQQLAGLTPGTADYIATLQTLADTYKLADSGQAQLLMQMSDQVKMGGAAGDAFKKMTLEMKTAEGASKQLQDQYAESTNNILRQAEQLGSKIAGLWARFQYWAEQFLTPILSAVNQAASAIGWVVDKIGWLTDTLDWALSYITPFAHSFSFLAGGVITAGLAMYAFRGGLGAIGNFMAWLVASPFKKLGGAFTGLGSMIQSVMTGIGNGISSVMTGIGNALNAIGTKVAPVMVPLLALGASMLMVGAGAYFFANAVKTLIGTGWEGVGMMAALTVAVSLVGAAMVGLAYLAAPVSPVILLISGALVLAGGAAWLFAQAIDVAAESTIQIMQAVAGLGDSIWPAAGGMMAFAAAAIPFGVAIAGLAAASLLAMWPLSKLGDSMLALGTGVASAASGFNTLVPSARALADSSSKISDSLSDAAGSVSALASGAAVAATAMGTLASASLYAMPPLAGLGGVIAGTSGVMAVFATSMTLAASGVSSVAAGSTAAVPAVGLLTAGMVEFVAVSGQFVSSTAAVASAATALSPVMISLGTSAAVFGSAMSEAGAGARSVAEGVAMLLAVADRSNTEFVSMASSIAILADSSGTMASTLAVVSSFAAPMVPEMAALAAAVGTLASGVYDLSAGMFSLGAVAAVAGLSASRLAVWLDASASAVSDIGSAAAASARSMTSAALALVGFERASGAGAAGVLAVSAALVSVSPAAAAAAWSMYGLDSRMVSIASSSERMASAVTAATRAASDSASGINGSLVNLGAGMDKMRSMIAAVSSMDEALARLSVTSRNVGAIKTAAVGLQDAMYKMASGSGNLYQVRDLFDTLSRFAYALGTIGSNYENAANAVAGSNLASAIRSQAVEVGGQLDDLVGVFERYSTLLESAAMRVEVAVNKKAIPAIQRVRESGIDDIVKTQTIATVKIIEKEEGVRSGESQEVVELRHSNQLLREAIQHLAEIASTNRDIPAMAKAIDNLSNSSEVSDDPRDLASTMNSWG